MPNSLRCKIKHLCHNGTLTERERDRILKALELIPDSATNGDVIKALFPKYAKFQTDVQGVFLSDNDQTHICYTKDWWNAQYKRGDE